MHTQVLKIRALTYCGDLHRLKGNVKIPFLSSTLCILSLNSSSRYSSVNLTSCYSIFRALFTQVELIALRTENASTISMTCEPCCMPQWSHPHKACLRGAMRTFHWSGVFRHIILVIVDGWLFWFLWQGYPLLICGWWMAVYLHAYSIHKSTYITGL